MVSSARAERHARTARLSAAAAMHAMRALREVRFTMAAAYRRAPCERRIHAGAVVRAVTTEWRVEPSWATMASPGCGSEALWPFLALRRVPAAGAAPTPRRPGPPPPRPPPGAGPRRGFGPPP